MDDSQLITMPVIALRGLVVFPHMQLHFDVGRTKSVEAVKAAMDDNRMVFLAAQKNIEDDEPAVSGICKIGCVVRIKQIVKLPGDTLRVVADGVYRGKSETYIKTDPYFSAEIGVLNDKQFRGSDMLLTALIRSLKEAFNEYADVNVKLSPDIVMHIMTNNSLNELPDYIAANIPFELDVRQQVLAQTSPVKRAEYILQELKREIELLKIEQGIEQRVHENIDDNQRDYFLREQLKVISEELGDDENLEAEAEKYRSAINKLEASDEVREKLNKEADRLLKMPSGSHEATVIRGYIDTCLELPWGKKTKEKYDIAAAEKILDRDHFGLEKVKERILEVIATRKLAPDIKGQIICLIGPPGTGKTSIAKSIAACMGRKYSRISLGGVRDEADIRGHRRTYIGAMPGRIIDAVRQSKSQNPLILMDEIDKLGSDFHGDPSSALLEALDPEQNVAFHDHFIEVPFDLSDVFFVLTANSADTIPQALLDRMEVISLTSYTREEKYNIAKKHLMPKQLKRHGLNSKTCRISNDAVYSLIDNYTREAGVRNLERQLASLCRKAAKKIVSGELEKVSVKSANLEEFLGPYKFKPEQFLHKNYVGVVNGLAWTEVGGEILQIEAAVLPGTGKIILTGSLGDVMKESAQAAISYIRSRASSLNISGDFYKDTDIHIHAPEGAVPKDGPSAGITMAVALISALSNTPVKGTVAMTGEITLRGRVLPIGGLKEKTMAAYKAGMKTVIIPDENKPDLSEVDKIVTDNIEFVTAEHLDDVLKIAFVDDGYVSKASSNKSVNSDFHLSGTSIKSDTKIPDFV